MTNKRTAVSSTSATNTSNPPAGRIPTYISNLKKGIAINASQAVKALKKVTVPMWIMFALGCVLYAVNPYLGASGHVMLGQLYSIANDTKISGRSDGNVWMRNGRIRGMRVPSNPNTIAQANQRTNLSSLSSQWNALSAGQRATWLASVSFKKANRFGVLHTVKGKELFVMLNRNLYNAGISSILIAPIPTTFNNVRDITLASDVSSGTVTMSSTTAVVPAGHAYLVFVTRQLNAGINTPGKSEYRLITVLAAASSTTDLLFTAYTTRFGSLTAGQKIFIKVVDVITTTGQADAGMVGSTIIVP